MTTHFFSIRLTGEPGNANPFLVALSGGVFHSSRKGLPNTFREDLHHVCMDMDADATSATAEAGWTVTRLDAEAETAALHLQLEGANDRAIEAFRLFQLNTTATELLTACGNESLVMDAIRNELDFLADPTARA